MTLLVFGGCHPSPGDIGKEPHLTPVGSTLQRPMSQLQAQPQRQPIFPNSTWSDRSADLFRDARAIRPGDILTVKISINDKASFDSTANRSRDAKLDMQGKVAFDVDAFGAKKTGSGSLAPNMSSSSSSDAHGAVTRSETLELLVAATVTEILGNGNLVISGTQEVRVNYEVRVLNIEGIVRARDISTENSVSYEKIAEARVSYGGRGRSMEVLQPAIGHQLIDLLSPF